MSEDDPQIDGRVAYLESQVAQLQRELASMTEVAEETHQLNGELGDRWREDQATIEHLRELLAAASDYIAHDDRSALWRDIKAELKGLIPDA